MINLLFTIIVLLTPVFSVQVPHAKAEAASKVVVAEKKNTNAVNIGHKVSLNKKFVNAAQAKRVVNVKGALNSINQSRNTLHTIKKTSQVVVAHNDTGKASSYVYRHELIKETVRNSTANETPSVLGISIYRNTK